MEYRHIRSSEEHSCFQYALKPALSGDVLGVFRAIQNLVSGLNPIQKWISSLCNHGYIIRKVIHVARNS
jgi:hypothetical protein